jgi:hypothetical protein
MIPCVYCRLAKPEIIKIKKVSLSVIGSVLSFEITRNEVCWKSRSADEWAPIDGVLTAEFSGRYRESLASSLQVTHC